MSRELLMMQNSFQWETIEGQTLQLDNAIRSKARDLKIEGQTYQDVFVNRPNSEANSDYTFKPDGVTLVLKGVNSNRHFDVKDKSSYMLKTGTYYTYVVNIIRNNNTEEVGLYFNSSYQNEISYFTATHIVNVPKGFTGTLKFLIETKTDFSSVTVADRSYLGTNGKTLDVDIKFNYYILEGNYTNTDLPTEINGIESVAERESKNLFKDEGWINKHLNYSDNTLRCSNNFRLQVELNADYTVNFETNNPNLQLTVNGFNTDGNWFIAGFNSDWLNKNQMPYSFKITNPEVKSIGFMFRYKNNEPISPTSSDVLNSNITVTEVNKYPVRISQSHNETDGIILPNGVKNTIENGNYIKRVGKYTITGTETYDLRFKNDYMFVVQFGNILTESAFVDYNHSNTKMICDKALCRDCSNTTFVSNSLTIGGRATSSKGFIIAIPKSLLTENTIDKAKEYIKSLGGMTVYYELATPITQPLELTKINLPQPLRRLPNGVCDEVVGNKLIQRVYELKLDENFDFSKSAQMGSAPTDTSLWRIDIGVSIPTVKGNLNSVTSNMFPYLYIHDLPGGSSAVTQECVSNHSANRFGINIIIKRSRLTSLSVDGFKEWCIANNFKMLYQLETPIVHEITQPIIPISKGGNIVTTINNIQPNLKFKYKKSKK